MCCGKLEHPVRKKKLILELEDVHKMNIPQQEELILGLVREHNWDVPYRFVQLVRFLCKQEASEL